MPYDGSNLDEATRLLIAGRERIIERGWCQNIAEDTGGRVCVVGALALGMGPALTEAMVRLARAVGVSLIYIARWNDMAGRTREQVLEAFDKAIAG